MKPLARLGVIVTVAAAIVAVIGSNRAHAEDYPSKPIRLIVVTAAGGLMDVAARVLADSLDKSLGQRLVIENRSGSGGNIGAEAVVRSDPDGYTLGLVQLGKLSYGSGGAGTAPHLAGEMFKAQAGVDILHVPYRGVGPAVNDTVGGHVQLSFAGLGAVRSGVDAGALKILAVAQSQRLKP